MTLATSLLALALLFQGSPARQGIAEFKSGNYVAARQLLERAGNDAEARLFLALTRAAMGECAAVVPELQRRSGQGQEDATARRLAGLALAQCYIAGKQFAAAGGVVARLEQEFPTDPDVLYVSANYHMKAWNDAIYRMYKSAPGSYRADELSAEVFETQGRYADAVGEYRKAIAKNPKAINLHYRLGRALLMQSHEASALEEARKEFTAELTLNPSDAVAEYQVAQILIAQQKKADAAGHFERALTLRPDFPEALIAVAKLRSDSKRYGEAITLLERAVKLQPRSEGAHYALMMAYRNAGRSQDADREKTEVEKIQSSPEGEFTDFLKKLNEKVRPAQ